MTGLDFPGEEVGPDPLDFPGTDVGKVVIPPGFAPIPAPEGIERPAEPKPSVPREVFVGGGAIPGAIYGGKAGAAMGAPTGPAGAAAGALAGSLVGGALGAAGGSYAYDATELAYRRRGGWPVESTPDYLTRTTKQALKEAGYDFGYGMAGELVGRGLGRLPQLTGSLLGVRTPEAMRKAEQARTLGIDVGTAHVSEFGFVRGAPRVVGVFPLVGKPYRVGQERVVGEIDDWGADIINTMAPPSVRYDVAKGLTKAAKKHFDKFVNLKAAAYKNFDDIAASLSVKDIVPTKDIRETVFDIAAKEDLEKVVLESGEEMTRFKNDSVGLFLHQLSDLPEHITVEQARGLQRELNDIVRSARRTGYDVSRISDLYNTLGDAVHNLDTSRLNPGEGEAVTTALDKANQFFASAKEIFESPTAQKFARAEKKIFEPGFTRPGSIEIDQVYDLVYKSKSPLALHDLRRLVGKKAFNSATRQFLTDAYEKSRVAPPVGTGRAENLFDAAAFERRLGLNTPEGWGAMEEMLKGSGVSVKDWANFLQATKTATDIVVRDPSTFLARRMVLAGGTLGGAIGAGLVGGAHVTLPTAALLTYVLNRSSKMLMDPKALRLMQAAASNTSSQTLKHAAVSRLLHMSGPEEEPLKIEGETP